MSESKGVIGESVNARGEPMGAGVNCIGGMTESGH